MSETLTRVIKDIAVREKNQEHDLILPFKNLAHSKNVFKNVGYISYKIERQKEPSFYSFNVPEREGLLASATYIGNGTIVTAAHVFAWNYKGYTELPTSERLRYYFR